MSESVTASAAEGDRRRALRLACIALVLAALPWLAWRSILALELLGWDSYPMIASSSLAHPLRTLTQELMGGRYPLGHYWRPLVQLTFAFDRALWGLRPLGYHVTDLALLSFATVAAFALALRLVRNEIAALTAALVYAVHPVHFEILQAPARRADAMCAAFTMLALALAAGGARRWLAAFAVLAALASKETGAIAAPAIFALAACTSESGTLLGRAKDAWRAAWPAFAATGVWFAARALVLGGLGGGSGFDLGNALVRAPQAIAGYGAGIFGLRDASGSRATSVALCAVGVALVALLAYASRRSARAGAGAGVAVFLAAWLLGLAAVTGTSGVDRAWYELPFLPIHALLVAFLVARGVATWRDGPRAAAAGAFVLATLFMAADVARSPFVVTRPELARASHHSRAFLERFEREVGAAAPGSLVRLDAFPMSERSDGRAGDPASPEVTVLAPYSLVAYAELVLGGKRIRPVAAGTNFARPEPDEVVVVLSR